MNACPSLDTANSAEGHKDDAWRYASPSCEPEDDVVSDASSVSTATEACASICSDDNTLRDVQSFRCDDGQSELSIDEECDARMDDINSNCKEFAFTSDDVGRIGVTDDKHAQTLSEVSSLCSFEVWETVDDDSGEGSGIITESTVELSHVDNKVKDEINEASSVRKDEESGERRVVVEEKVGNMLDARVEKDIVLSEKKSQKEAACKKNAKAAEACDKNSPYNTNVDFIPAGMVTQCNKSTGIYTIDKPDAQESKQLTIPKQLPAAKKPRVSNLDFLRGYILPELERQESLSSNSGSEPAKRSIKPKYGKDTDYISVYSQKRLTTSKKQSSSNQVIEKGVIPSKGNTVENHDSKQVTCPIKLPLPKQCPANKLKQKPQNQLVISIKKRDKDISQYSQRAPIAGKNSKSAENHIAEKYATKQLTQPRQLPPLKKPRANNLEILRSYIISELERQEILSTISGSESNNHAKKNIKPKYGNGYVSPYEQKPLKELDMSANKGKDYTSIYNQKGLAASEKQACSKVNGKGTNPGNSNLHLETYKSASAVVQSMATDDSGKMNMASNKNAELRSKSHMKREKAKACNNHAEVRKRHTKAKAGHRVYEEIDSTTITKIDCVSRMPMLKLLDANKHTPIIMGRKPQTSATVSPRLRSLKPLDANKLSPIIMEGKLPAPPTVAPPCRSIKPLDADRHTPIIMGRKPPSLRPMSLWKTVVTANLRSKSCLVSSCSRLGYSVLPNRSCANKDITKTSFQTR